MFALLRNVSGNACRLTPLKSIETLLSVPSAECFHVPMYSFTLCLRPTPSARAFHLTTAMRTSRDSSGQSTASTITISPLQQAPLGIHPHKPGSSEKKAKKVAASSQRHALPTTAMAKACGLKIGPKKLNEFARVVRGRSLRDALIQCEMSVKKAAKMVEKGLRSAAANAVNNNGMDPSALALQEIHVGRGTHLKRIRYHGRGRSGVKLRYRSHLTIVLCEKESAKRSSVHIQPTMMERFFQKRLSHPNPSP